LTGAQQDDIVKNNEISIKVLGNVFRTFTILEPRSASSQGGAEFMRIAVLGGGARGALFGGWLQRSRADVFLADVPEDAVRAFYRAVGAPTPINEPIASRVAALEAGSLAARAP
jgi:hypothetical protein